MIKCNILRDDRLTNITKAIEELEQENLKSPGFRGIGLLEGPARSRKTSFAISYARIHKAIYLRALWGMTPNSILKDIIEGLGYTPRGTVRTNSIVLRLAQETSPRLVIFDEAELLIMTKAHLELIGQLHIVTGTPFLLICRPGAWEKIMKQRQSFAARVGLVIQIIDFIKEV